LDVSASAYYQRKTGARSRRRVEDERLLERIRQLHAANYYAYGSRRMWKALRRAGESVGRGRVERLMRTNGICGAKRRRLSDVLCVRSGRVVDGRGGVQPG
jgi:putative transposase